MEIIKMVNGKLIRQPLTKENILKLIKDEIKKDK